MHVIHNHVQPQSISFSALKLAVKVNHDLVVAVGSVGVG